MEHKDFIKKWYDSILDSIPHDVNTINSIIDEHHKLWKVQRFIRLVVLFSTAFCPLIACFLINNSVSFFYIFIIAFSWALLFKIDRETIQFLIVLTSYYPDVQQELFDRLLSGKKLTIRDEQEIEDTCLRKNVTCSKR